MDLCRQSDVSVFEYAVCHSFSSKEQMSFNFMAAVTSTEILEAKEIKSVSVASFLPSYLP